jgi:DNA-binding GntR family transcriptional regulator
LEGLAARLAVSNLKSGDIRSMELALWGMIETKVKDFKTYFKHHVEFHEIFINASQNEVLINILENLRRQALWFRFTYLWHEGKYDMAIATHEKILDLFVQKETNAVGELVEQHILIALDEFKNFLRSKTTEGS